MSDDSPNEPRTLLVEPDAPRRRSWEGALRGRGHVVMGTAQAEAARLLADSFRPDVIVWNSGDHDGEIAMRSLRESTDAYVIAVGEELTSERRAVLLTAGADAVITLPCSSAEVVAQVSTLLRRPKSVVIAVAPTGTRRRFGPLELDAGRREAVVNGRRLSLTRIEFDALAHLCSHPQEMVTREELVEAVWGPKRSEDTHMVDVHISNLRRKLDQAAPGVAFIQTVRGMGFRLSADLAGEAV